MYFTLNWSCEFEKYGTTKFVSKIGTNTKKFEKQLLGFVFHEPTICENLTEIIKLIDNTL